MKLTIEGPAKNCGVSKLLLEEPPYELQLDIEPNAEGETPHLYVTAIVDGENFEGRIYHSSQSDAEKNVLVFCADAEDEAWRKELADQLNRLSQHAQLLPGQGRTDLDAILRRVAEFEEIETNL